MQPLDVHSAQCDSQDQRQENPQRVGSGFETGIACHMPILKQVMFASRWTGCGPTHGAAAAPCRSKAISCMIQTHMQTIHCIVYTWPVDWLQGDFQDAVTDDTIDLVFTAQTESTNYDSDTYDFVVVEKDYV